MKKIRYFIEFIFVYIFFSILKFLPMNFVSYLGGMLFQIIGTFTKYHKIAISNYKKAIEIKKDYAEAYNNL